MLRNWATEHKNNLCVSSSRPAETGRVPYVRSVVFVCSYLCLCAACASMCVCVYSEPWKFIDL